MASNNSILSNNIKFLRKELKLSQEGLAESLGIKRSNIAAYESKNVEPRLRLILEMAKLFDINIRDFIEITLANDVEYRPFDHDLVTHDTEPQPLMIEDNPDINAFVSKSMKVKKILEGFKAFYSFKKTSISETTPDQNKLIYDIDGFIQLMEHLLAYNESIIKAIHNKQLVDNNA